MFLPDALSGLYDFSDSGAARTNINLSAEHVNIITLDFPSQRRVGQPKAFVFCKGLPSRKLSTTKFACYSSFTTSFSTMFIRSRIRCCTYWQKNSPLYLLGKEVYKTQILKA